MSTCRETTSSTAFGSNGEHCRLSAGDLRGCVKFWLHEINVFMSTALTSAVLSEVPLAEQNDCQHFVTGNTAGTCTLRNDMGNVFGHSKGNIKYFWILCKNTSHSGKVVEEYFHSLKPKYRSPLLIPPDRRGGNTVSDAGDGTPSFSVCPGTPCSPATTRNNESQKLSPINVHYFTQF